MKKIWPSTQDDLAQMQPINCKPITQQQYDDLVERTNCAVCKADIASDKVDALREDMDTAIATQKSMLALIHSKSLLVRFAHSA